MNHEIKPNRPPRLPGQLAAELQECAAKKMTVAQAGFATGTSESHIRKTCKAHGITLRPVSTISRGIITACADAGMSRHETAAMLGVAYKAVQSLSLRTGVKFRDASTRNPENNIAAPQCKVVRMSCSPAAIAAYERRCAAWLSA